MDKTMAWKIYENLMIIQVTVIKLPLIGRGDILDEGGLRHVFPVCQEKILVVSSQGQQTIASITI